MTRVIDRENRANTAPPRAGVPGVDLATDVVEDSNAGGGMAGDATAPDEQRATAEAKTNAAIAASLADAEVV